VTASPSILPGQWNPPLLRAEGTALLTAHQAIVKGALESELAVDAIVAPRQVPFEPVFALRSDPAAARALEQHRMTVTDSVDAARAVSLAVRAAGEGKRVLALVPNEQLAMATSVARRSLDDPGSLAGGVVFLIEDNPYLVRLASPWEAARSLGLPVVAPDSIERLRDGIEHAFRLANAGPRMAAIVVHAAVLRSVDSPTLRANRVLDRLEQAAALLRARRGARVQDADDPLRVVRRLELNHVSALPSPGEREPIAFIAVGPASMAIHHILGAFGLEGRVPVLDLGCSNPMDDALLERFLTRCDDAVVLEPRPGSVAPAVLAVAEGLRARGERPARLWWDRLPPRDGEDVHLEINDAVRTSILLRKAMHLFRLVRSGLEHSPRLAAPVPSLESLPVPRRSFGLGPTGALDSIRQVLPEAAADVARVDPDAPDAPTRALALEGAEPPQADIVTEVELWDRRRFAVEGPAAIRQAAIDPQPTLFVVADLGGSDVVDVERLANAAVPLRAAPRLHVLHCDLNDRPALVAAVAQAARLDGVGVVVAHDGPPARRDIRQLEASVAEADRLGFTPSQRLVWPADTGCDVRPIPQAELMERGLERGLDPLRTEFVRETFPAGDGLPVRIEVRALLEQVEVVRTRPPPVLREDDARLKPPRAIHGREGTWRCHLAGFRGEPPGLATIALCEAGRAMGYRVQSIYHPTPVGPGRRAWGQVLFTSEDRSAEARTHATQCPYGEADLLLGFDPVETLRAIGPDPYLRVAAPDKTSVVANLGAFEDQVVPELAAAVDLLPRALPMATRSEGALLADIAGTARREFLTDRVADLVALGAAFQRGFVPVSVEAMEAAMRRMESRGFGRSLEAFTFGRRLAEGLETAQVDARRGESLGRLVRRTALELEASRHGGRRRARQFRELVRETIDAMPALYATNDGRQALRDFVAAAARCVAWGGVRHLRWYVGLVRDLYEAGDRDPERALCTYGLLPLAESILMRDALYVAAIQASVGQARRIRERLGVRELRGDQMTRRYLNRIEVVLGRTKWRLDLRSSDWPAQLALILWRIVPNELRGQPGERRFRAAALAVFERALAEPGRRDHWVAEVRRLHALASEHRLRDLPAAELEAKAAG
jgi:Pyruvate/2-oxoacid:ferredoxin oxidoreductase gamma subunit